VRLVSSLDEVPAHKRDGVGRIEIDASQMPGRTAAGASASTSRSARRAASGKRPEVVVFTSGSCGRYCGDMMRDLDALGIDYRERNIDRDATAARQLAKRDQRRPVPTVMVGDSVWQGYNPSYANAVRHKLDYVASGGGEERVIVYTQAQCGYSRRLMADLDALGVAYENRDIDRSPSARSELLQLTGSTGVPVAVVGGDLLNGYAPGRAKEIRSKLDSGWSLKSLF
jgi:glutaredoxin